MSASAAVGGEVRPGRPFPLGATPTVASDGTPGTNFALASADATGVTLCLFDGAGAERQVPLLDVDAGVWHGFVPGIGPGARYRYRVDGPWDPAAGLRFNPAKLLLDPYAKAVDGEVTFGPEVLGQDVDDPSRPSSIDSAGHVPRSLVVDGRFDWEDDRPPGHRMADTVFYEAHVKGLTMTHPALGPELQGTYAGLAHPVVIDHLVELGVTAVELLPVHQSVSEAFLPERGLTNYWGYNTVGYLAPHAAYSAEVRAGRPGGQVAEFKAMVAALHRAGIEVILDVVFNHTCAAGPDGPTLCFRGIDNRTYYRLEPDDPSRYVDTTGCGNSLNVHDTTTLRLVMDSLRYWVSEMHVDGFRFDLAPALARGEGRYDKVSAFFDLVAQDPVVSQVKLVAEPWDVGQGDSYALGDFPPLWSEWNGRFRDTVRDFWRGTDGVLPDLASRLAGSEELFGDDGRRPNASVNLVTVHDGFTLADLVAYDHKHNEANGEDNRDGNDDNRSWNGGVEGPTDDAEVLENRARRARGMLATTLLALGVPLVCAGDELGRTQRGNNNAYCQDDEISWIDWSNVDTDLLTFTRELVWFRREHPVLRRQRYLTGALADELRWFSPTGLPMAPEDWADAQARCVAVLFDGHSQPDRGPDGELLVDDDLLVLVNGWRDPVVFTLPPALDGRTWRLSEVPRPPEPVAVDADGTISVPGWSVVALLADGRDG